jgi:ferric-dicitrate binding protein FerR (iron transport regulator)
MTGTSSYYWAGGRRIALEDDSRIAVDIAGAERAELWDGELAAAAAAGAPVSSGVVLVPGAELSPVLRAELDSSGAAHPVYRSDDQTVIVLPEVRVETSPNTTVADMRSAVAGWDVVVDQPASGRFVLTPASHRGADALALANHVTESVGPAAAQARFLRITPDHTQAPPEEGSAAR